MGGGEIVMADYKKMYLTLVDESTKTINKLIAQQSYVNKDRSLNSQLKQADDYKKLYVSLMDEVTKAISKLTGALDKAEDIYIKSCGQDPEMVPLKKAKEEADA